MKISQGEVSALRQGNQLERDSSETITYHPLPKLVGQSILGRISSGIAALGVILGLQASLLLRAQSPLPDNFNPGANGSVSSLAVMADGKILLGGGFTTLGGQVRDRIGRLNPNGTLDTGFNPGANGVVSSLAVQADGKILVGGRFTALDGQVRHYIGRLNSDGTLDAGFNPSCSAYVESLAVQTDGKILVGGAFTSLSGQTRNYIGRLNPDGTLDTGFNPGADLTVYSLTVQADGKILAGGSFTTMGGEARSRIARLSADGTLDSGFNPGASGGSVASMVVQADGKILVGGDFWQLGGRPRSYIGRLNLNGMVDTNFNPGANYVVSSMSLQTDGKILVGGLFEALGGQARNHIGRLNPDGTLDTGFNPGASVGVSSLAIQADGKVLVGGPFGVLGGQIRKSIGRLNVTEPATKSLTYDGSTITWSRGGSSPEVWRTTFDWSSDGLLWTPLGEGTRLPGGWRRTNAIVPTQVTIRARGFVAGGGFNASGWFVEDFLGPLVWIAQPVSRTNDAGSTATFGGAVGGTPPLSYQWFKGGVAVTDGGRIAGATTGWLTLTNVLGADAGDYQLVVSNSYGARTSVVATLTVNEPVITVPPVSQNREPGENATLNVTAHGTTLGYQWWKDGEVLTGRTGASISLTNLSLADAGVYWVVVTSPYGSATSSVAWLTVNGTTVEARFRLSASSYVSSLAVQADGKILLGGGFTTLGGETRNYIGRLNPNGTLDTGFNPGASGSVSSLAVQADGKILVGGSFWELGGQSRNRIGRLNPDGTLDTGFNPGASSDVESIVVQADGKILVGGGFTNLGGQTRKYIGRLNLNGTLDTGFDPGADRNVHSLAMQADGKILVGGSFTNLGGQLRNRIGRLNPDGTPNTGFDPGADGSVNGGPVYSLVVQADGKILVGGYFNMLGGQLRNYIGRLDPDGTLDRAFNPGADNQVSSMVLQADGKILVGGSFTNLADQPRKYIGRLNSDGTPDTGFNPGASSYVYSLAVQADGKILVGGFFTTLGGQTRNRIGRLNATEPPTQSLTYDGSAIAWLRGSSSPELWRTTFDWSSDGLLWTSLGEGTRVPGGWQWTGAAVPAFTTIRARGFVAGDDNASGWFVENLIWYAGALPLTVERGLGGLSNLFAFSTTTTRNQALVVEASSNLVNWVPVYTNAPTNGLFQYSDPSLASNSFRFYRAYQMP